MVRRDIPLYEEHIYKIKNKYQFILAVAKRARMLVDGAPVAPGIAGVKPTTRALGELLHHYEEDYSAEWLYTTEAFGDGSGYDSGRRMGQNRIVEPLSK